MAQLLGSGFSIFYLLFILCVTWTTIPSPTLGEDVLDDLGVEPQEAHPFQAESVSEDGFSRINTVGNETGEQSVPEGVNVKPSQENAEARDDLFRLYDGNGQIGGDIPLSELESDHDTEDEKVNAGEAVREEDSKKDALDSIEVDDDSEPEKYAGAPKLEETEDYNKESKDQDASKPLWNGQEILDFINPNATERSMSPEEQTEGKAGRVQDNEKEATTSLADIKEDIFDMDGSYPGEYKAPRQQSTSESVDVPSLLSADDGQYSSEKVEQENNGGERKFSSVSTSPSENAVKAATHSDDWSDAVNDNVTAQVDYRKFLDKIYGTGGTEGEEYADNSESEDLDKEFEDYFDDDDDDDDDDEEYSDVSNGGDEDLYSDETSENITDVTHEGDADLDAVGSFHPLSKEQSEASSEHQAADVYEDGGAEEKEKNVMRGKEDGGSEGQDTEGGVPQAVSQEDQDDDSDDDNDDYHDQIPDYGAGGNYEETDWYYDPLRNGEANSKDETTARTTPGASQNIDDKPGIPTRVSAPEFEEVAEAQDVQQAKRQLAGPTGMILLYTGLIVLFIAGIVLITVWKQPFHGWIRNRLGGKVLPADEGKRLLDHQFV